jgi:hypothetical protein
MGARSSFRPSITSQNDQCHNSCARLVNLLSSLLIRFEQPPGTFQEFSENAKSLREQQYISSIAKGSGNVDTR